MALDVSSSRAAEMSATQKRDGRTQNGRIAGSARSTARPNSLATLKKFKPICTLRQIEPIAEPALWDSAGPAPHQPSANEVSGTMLLQTHLFEL
jgi:hypothetical protein